MAKKTVSDIYNTYPKTADDFTDNDIFYFATAGADGAAVLSELRKKLQRSETEAFSATITADKNKNIGQYNLASGALTLSMAASGNNPGVRVVFKIIADGVNAVNIGSGFDADGLIGIESGEVLPEGNYLVEVTYHTTGAVIKLPSRAVGSSETPESVKTKYESNADTNAFTNAYKSQVDANAEKVGITTEQANAIVANTAKVGITTEQANAIVANTAKVGITTEQANAIVANTAKVSYDAAAQAEMVANNAKVSYTDAATVSAHDAKLATIEEGAQVNPTDAEILESVESELGFPIANSGIENAGTVEESATLDFSESDMFTMPLTSNLDVTAITGLSAIGIVKFVHNGFALTINTSLIPANKNAGFVDRGGAYYVKFINHSETETPDYSCGDVYGTSLSEAEISAMGFITEAEAIALMQEYVGGTLPPSVEDIVLSADTWESGSDVSIAYTYVNPNLSEVLEDTSGTGSEYEIRRYADSTAANADTDKSGGTLVDSGITGGSPVTDVYTIVAGDVGNVLMAWVRTKSTNGYSDWTKSNVSSEVTSVPTYEWTDGFDEWDLTNPNSANVPFTRSASSMSAAHDGTATTTLSANYNENPVGLTGTEVIFSFNLAKTGLATALAKGVVMRNADGTRVAMILNNFSGTDDVTDVRLRTTIDGSTIEELVSVPAFDGTYKVRIQSTQIIFERWNASTEEFDELWVSTRSFGSHEWKMRMACANTSGGGKVGTISVSKAYATYTDFATQYPA